LPQNKEKERKHVGSARGEGKEEESVYRPLVPALDQAVQILLCLQDNAGDKMTLTRICQSVGIHKSKGYSILTTLQRYGLVEKDPQAKTYRLGARLIPLARNVLDHLDFRAVAASFIEELAKETGQTVWFGLRKDESIFVVAKHEGGGHFWVTPGIGHTFNLHEGAHGKAILAFLSEAERKNILSFRKGTASLIRELASVKIQGFAQDIGQFSKGINAVAAPVFGPGHQVVGVVCLFGTFPEDKSEKFGRRIAATARQISERLGSQM
jgi:DNA-binding IclR family transcriptional regulator